MSGAETSPETPGVVVGNVTDKHSGGNVAVRWLTRRFLDRVDRMLDSIGPLSTPPLEVGTGEGAIASRLHERFGSAVALDLPDAGLRHQWRLRPGPTYLHGSALQLPFAAESFDVVLAVEVLEHLPEPRTALRELMRVSRRDLLVSVPREPLFRLSNLAAGRYVRAAGNTPGHLNHWSTRRFVSLVSEVASVVAVATPFPWTLVHARR